MDRDFLVKAASVRWRTVRPSVRRTRQDAGEPGRPPLSRPTTLKLTSVKNCRENQGSATRNTFRIIQHFQGHRLRVEYDHAHPRKAHSLLVTFLVQPWTSQARPAGRPAPHRLLGEHHRNGSVPGRPCRTGRPECRVVRRWTTNHNSVVGSTAVGLACS